MKLARYLGILPALFGCAYANAACTNSGAAFVPSFLVYGNKGREHFVNVSNVSDGSVTVDVVLFGEDGVDRTEDFVESTQPLVVPPKGTGRIEIIKSQGGLSEPVWGRVRWESESSRCLNKPLLATLEESRLENGGSGPFIGTRAIRNGNRF